MRFELIDSVKFTERKICNRCILPETSAGIWLNSDGICSVCLDFDKNKELEEGQKLHETDLVNLLNRYRGKGQYDVLAMCSGGKDSTSALYYMVKKYKMKVLAFTFDNGFETEEALRNVKMATDKLGCDFLYYKTDYMKNMYSNILKSESKAVICHPCSIWYINLSYETAAKYNIPLIVAGWTKGQSNKQEVMSKCGCNVNQPEFKKMSDASQDFFDKFLVKNEQYKNFPRTMAEVLKRAKKKHKSLVISPHWFLPTKTDEYVKTIQTELGWNFPKLSYPGKSTNCTLNFISVHNSMKYFGYTHYHVEMSKMIRNGLISREDALNDLEIKFDYNLLNGIAKKLDYQFEKEIKP